MAAVAAGSPERIRRRTAPKSPSAPAPNAVIPSAAGSGTGVKFNVTFPPLKSNRVPVNEPNVPDPDATVNAVGAVKRPTFDATTTEYDVPAVRPPSASSRKTPPFATENVPMSSNRPARDVISDAVLAPFRSTPTIPPAATDTGRPANDSGSDESPPAITVPPLLTVTAACIVPVPVSVPPT
ncbi:MAG: hypothetical protein ACRC7O_11170 [Fimbriiglobus sp.]